MLVGFVFFFVCPILVYLCVKLARLGYLRANQLFNRLETKQEGEIEDAKPATKATTGTRGPIRPWNGRQTRERQQ